MGYKSELVIGLTKSSNLTRNQVRRSLQQSSGMDLYSQCLDQSQCEKKLGLFLDLLEAAQGLHHSSTEKCRSCPFVGKNMAALQILESSQLACHLIN